MLHPLLQFVSIRDLERDVVKADAAFVEFARQRFVVNLFRDRHAGWVQSLRDHRARQRIDTCELGAQTVATDQGGLAVGSRQRARGRGVNALR